MAAPKGKNLQKFLKQRNPQAKSAKLKEAVDMLENLKQTNTNIRAINAVGPQNLLAMLQSLKKKFPLDFANTLMDIKIAQVQVQQLVNAQNPNNVFRPIEATTHAVPNSASSYAPIGAAFVVTETSPDLTNERIVTSTNTIYFDTAISGQLKAHVNTSGLSLAANVANTTVLGVVEIATVAEANAGVSSTTVVTPEGLKAHVDYAISGISSSTNLTVEDRDADSLVVASDTGTDATILSANTTLAGLLSAADKTKLDGISPGAGAAGGANTYVQFNDTGAFNGTAGFTFNKDTNNAVIGNNIAIGANATITAGWTVGANVFANTSTIVVANATHTTTAIAGFVTAAGPTGATYMQETGLVAINGMFAGNSTVNLTAFSTTLNIANSTGVSNLTPTQLSVGANVILDTVKLSIGNTTANLFANSLYLGIANSTGVSNLTPTQLSVGANAFLDTVKLSIGNTTVNALANSLFIQFANSTTTSNLTSSQVSLGANVFLSTVALSIGNTTVNAFSNSLFVQFANSTQTANLTAGLLSIGNTTVNATVNSTAFALNGVALPTGFVYLSNVIVFTSNGTWTKPANFYAMLVKGGGAGGGGSGVRASGSQFAGAGGGGGGYFELYLSNSEVSSSQTVTVGIRGAGGVGNTSTGQAGANGGNTVFGTFATAVGGNGAGNAVNLTLHGGIGGTATGGDINIDGRQGFAGVSLTDTVVKGGDGGDSMLGKGGSCPTYTTTNRAGGVGLNYGGGGAGGAAASGNASGGIGANGILIVYEYSKV